MTPKVNNNNKNNNNTLVVGLLFLDPPKPFNLTLYTIDRDLKFLNVFWYVSQNPDFFTLIVCKLEAMCYEKILLNETKTSPINFPWTKKIDLHLKTGLHRLYIVSHANNLSVNATTDFIIGKNLK